MSANNTLQDERRLTNEEFLTIANSRRAKVLDFEADLLERERIIVKTFCNMIITAR